MDDWLYGYDQCVNTDRLEEDVYFNQSLLNLCCFSAFWTNIVEVVIGGVLCMHPNNGGAVLQLDMKQK